MEVILRKTPEDCAEVAAKIVEKFIGLHPRPVLGLESSGLAP